VVKNVVDGDFPSQCSAPLVKRFQDMIHAFGKFAAERSQSNNYQVEKAWTLEAWEAHVGGLGVAIFKMKVQ